MNEKLSNGAYSELKAVVGAWADRHGTKSVLLPTLVLASAELLAVRESLRGIRPATSPAEDLEQLASLAMTMSRNIRTLENQYRGDDAER